MLNKFYIGHGNLKILFFCFFNFLNNSPKLSKLNDLLVLFLIRYIFYYQSLSIVSHLSYALKKYFIYIFG